MNKPQILIVEDDPAIGNLIATTLETQNYQYHRAKTGAGAVMDALTPACAAGSLRRCAGRKCGPSNWGVCC